MNITIKAICTDIDGTLLDQNRQLSERTIRVIRKVAKRIPVILASSRMPSAMTHLQKELEIGQYPLICYNGGYVLVRKADGWQVFDSVEIPFNVVEAIVASCVNSHVHISLYRKDEWCAPQSDQWTDREERITKVQAKIESNQIVLERWAKTGAGAHKVMCMGDEAEIDHIQHLLHERLSNELHLYRSRPAYLEIAPRRISKGSALSDVLHAEYGISLENVMAFGDNYNDIDMLKSVGLGVAVANARPEVIAIAGEITLASVADGVALSVEKYCFPKEKD